MKETNYYVYRPRIDGRIDDEWLEKVTTDKEEAIQLAQSIAYCIARDNQSKMYGVEIRVFSTPEDEENQWNWDNIEF